MIQLATTDELGMRLGVVFDSEADPVSYGRAVGALEDVSAHAITIAERPEWAPGAIPPDVHAIILAAAQRIYRNPSAYRREQKREGPFSGERELDPLASAASVDVFTPTEVSKILKYRDRQNIGVISTERDPEWLRLWQLRRDTQYVRDVDGVPFPYVAGPWGY
ncbi:hypothetical protein [Tsukamurella soli]|uniref:Head-to-tail adaptor n=1 Tax=Tsukamurella soli TaxID=644556 RepID=A0ABP8JJJ0_9ACTN